MEDREQHSTKGIVVEATSPVLRVIPYGLVGFWATVNVLFISDYERHDSNHDNVYIFFGLVLGQISSVTGWLVLRSTHWELRVLLTAMMFSVVAAGIACGGHPAWDKSDSVSFLIGALLGYSSIFYAIRQAGFRCAQRGEVHDRAGSNWQFSLKQIMLLTAVVAVVLTVLGTDPRRYIQILAAATMTLLFSGLQTIIAWGGLMANKTIGIAISIAALSSLVVGVAVVESLLPRHLGPVRTTLLIHISMIVASIVNLLVLRFAGYRLLRYQHPSPSTTT